MGVVLPNELAASVDVGASGSGATFALVPDEVVLGSIATLSITFAAGAVADVVDASCDSPFLVLLLLLFHLYLTAHCRHR